MGRPPSSGGPAFRFTHAEVAEMEEHLRHLNNAIPQRNVIQGLAEKFTASAARAGKIPVQYKQGKMLPTGAEEHHPASFRAQGSSSSYPGSHSGKSPSDGGQAEFEAKSARDGAWYDVAAFLSHRLFETGDPKSFAAELVSRLEYGLRREKQTVDDLTWLVKLEVKVRFSGFGPEEDEWINVRKCVRLRSLPCESAECVAVLPGDLILCFQEGKEQALYFDARVLDAQRRRHDVRGCRCRFLVRYDHDHSEEIVPLRKVCRRPETDFRLQILHASRAAASADAQNVSPVEQKPQKAHKMMDVNTAEVTVVRNPDQGGPSDKPAAPLPAAPAGTHGDSVSDVQMGNVEVIPKVEAANEAHDDNMNVVA
uniref:Uncharacterized protein n=1 Tax=Aegilops tauschii TaxID=37682 RepID=M8B9D9_AEGTA